MLSGFYADQLSRQAEFLWAIMHHVCQLSPKMHKTLQSVVEAGDNTAATLVCDIPKACQQSHFILRELAHGIHDPSRIAGLAAQVGATVSVVGTLVMSPATIVPDAARADAAQKIAGAAMASLTGQPQPLPVNQNQQVIHQIVSGADRSTTPPAHTATNMLATPQLAAASSPLRETYSSSPTPIASHTYAPQQVRSEPVVNTFNESRSSITPAPQTFDAPTRATEVVREVAAQTSTSTPSTPAPTIEVQTTQSEPTPVVVEVEAVTRDAKANAATPMIETVQQASEKLVAAPAPVLSSIAEVVTARAEPAPIPERAAPANILAVSPIVASAAPPPPAPAQETIPAQIATVEKPATVISMANIAPASVAPAAPTSFSKAAEVITVIALPTEARGATVVMPPINAEKVRNPLTEVSAPSASPQASSPNNAALGINPLNPQLGQPIIVAVDSPTLKNNQSNGNALFGTDCKSKPCAFKKDGQCACTAAANLSNAMKDAKVTTSRRPQRAPQPEQTQRAA